MVSREFIEIWERFVFESFGLRVFSDARDKFSIYLAELISWNEKINLISVKSAEEIYYRHFGDSLAGLKAISGDPGVSYRTIDIGTGAGFPGIPLKIAMPNLKLTLLESITKKCAFLEELTGKLGFQDVIIINDRAENIGQLGAHRASYDIVLSRAVTKLVPNMEISIPLLKIGGRVILYKTTATGAESNEFKDSCAIMTRLGGRLSAAADYRIPGQEIAYNLLVIEKNAATPGNYPRRNGMPEKKPLV